MFKYLSGVYAAAVTPLNDDFSIILDDVLPLLEFLADRGCHGTLLFGTTGEGPSFSRHERKSLIEQATQLRSIKPEFRLLAGTGATSLDESIELTKLAFDFGVDGVVVLPPYYFRSVNEEGLYLWYSQLITEAVPEGKALFGYHIPSMTGIHLSITLLSKLKERFPQRFAGIKDSSGNPEHSQLLGDTFGEELVILNGSDRLFSQALENSASGCITALSNVISPDLRRVWDAHKLGGSDEVSQTRLNNYRDMLERYLPAPPLLKTLLSRFFNFKQWSLKPPLIPLDPGTEIQALADFIAIN